VHRRRPTHAAPEHYANRDTRFHLTLKAHPRFDKWPDRVREMIWQATVDENDLDRVQLFAACVMPDHLHLLIGPARFDVIRFADAFKSWTTRLAWKAGIDGAVWQPGIWDRTIRDEKDFDNVSSYIVRNPVGAGLVEEARAWPHTWAYWWDDEPGTAKA
jgi:REP element-mobilizing transposase RayT